MGSNWNVTLKFYGAKVTFEIAAGDSEGAIVGFKDKFKKKFWKTLPINKCTFKAVEL